MDYANLFYPEAKTRGYKIDYLNVHAYQTLKGATVKGPCKCDPKLLRDQMRSVIFLII